MKLQEIKEIANDTGVHAERGYHLKNFANRIVELDRQQRTWVGLTRDEQLHIILTTPPSFLAHKGDIRETAMAFAELVQKRTEAKLKEKNT